MKVLDSLLEREESLHKKAARSRQGVREREEKPSPVRTEFQRDRDRILHSKSFRRLKHKTQVFIAPEGDHYRTRLTHTLEVSQVSRTIAKALNLNEDLTEAIALGHDLGHTPFGHMGEKILDGLTNENFRHYEQSLRVVDKLEYDGKGLNLTDFVRDGILKHSKGFGEIIPSDTVRLPITLEGQIVRISDIIAYVNHDLDDAIRAKIIKNSWIPESVTKTLGPSFAKRIDRVVIDIISETLKAGLTHISISDIIYTEIINLRNFLFEKVYLRPEKEKEREKIEKILITIFNHLKTDPQKYLKSYPEGDSVERRAIDFIAGMTDRFAVNLFEAIIIPKYI